MEDIDVLGDLTLLRIRNLDSDVDSDFEVDTRGTRIYEILMNTFLVLGNL
jgi:hypothetical protein